MRLTPTQKTYLRYTRWHATRAVAQLLANLGASFAVDSRFFHPLDTWVLNLDGEWQMKPTLKLAAASSDSSPCADPGISPEVQKLLGETVSAEGWSIVKLPQMVPFFKDNDGEAVFRKELTIPKSQAGRDLLLELGALTDFDNTCFNGVEIGHTGMETTNWSKASRSYVVAGKLVKAGKNVIAVRLFNRYGPGGFGGKPGFPMGPTGDRSGVQATGPRVGLEMILKVNPQGPQALGAYYPDYLTDFHMGDNPYRYYRW